MMNEVASGRVEPGTPLRVLCIDDRAEDAELEQLSLSRAGYEVEATRVASESEFAAILAGCSYDVALLDYTLPGWDSRAALAQLLAASPDLPVISVAGTIGEETAVEMLKLGAADFVAKDRLARLPLVVRRALEGAAEHRARLAGRPVADVILQHHERLDGSGYPEGLRGDEIMLEARILAVADVVEAMSSHRPYRPALGVEAALAEVTGGAGERYDADVVAAAQRAFAAGFAFRS